MFAADLGLAMGPFPPSDSATTTPGDVYVGMARPGKTESRRFPFVGHPDIVKDRAVKMALNCLRLWVLES
jgi:nicotinamide mononucleotide (NMN) deamidase PncC